MSKKQMGQLLQFRLPRTSVRDVDRIARLATTDRGTVLRVIISSELLRNQVVKRRR